MWIKIVLVKERIHLICFRKIERTKSHIGDNKKKVNI